jgi:hypothetical protein
MEAWRDGTEDSSSMTDAAAKAFTNQTATSALS